MSGQILIVDDVATNRIVMKVKLSAARYGVTLASTGEEALEIARAGGIDVIIMDMVMPGASGADVCRALRADAATAGIPVILITAVDDAEARLVGLEAGADDFLTRPVDEVALLARVRSLLRTREEERDYGGSGTWMEHGLDDMRTVPPGALDLADLGAARGRLTAESALPGGMAEASGAFTHRPASASDLAGQPAATGRVAILSADPVEARALAKSLADTFRDRPVCIDRDVALALRAEAVPDVFLIDADLGGTNEGMRLMSELRSRNATRRAGCIILLPPGESERAATALDLGAADVAHRPVSPRELAMRLRTQIARKQRSDKMRASLERGLRMAVIDPLTGLYNRRYGLHHLERVASNCRGQGLSAGVILLDIDHFKAINDTHGHPFGDTVLTRVADMLRDQLRNEDVVCRIGGEEFLAVLPDATLEQVNGVAERLREAIGAISLALGDGERISVTVSIGVTMLEAREDACNRALARVDRALYAAKAEGRDRINVDMQHLSH